MQYFRNASRRGADVFPLCRDGKADSASPLGGCVQRDAGHVCGCGETRDNGRSDACREERRNDADCGCGEMRDSEHSHGCRGEHRDESGCGAMHDNERPTGCREERGNGNACGCGSSRESERGCGGPRTDGRSCGCQSPRNEENTCPYRRTEQGTCCRGSFDIPCENCGACTGLAMAFVPDQEFCDLNDADSALCAGSLFRQLDMPFYGQRRRT